MNEFEPKLGRSDARRFTALLVITAATSIALGVTLRQPTQMGANDISRWCTVWSLLERGGYIIDDCPWQLETQDKVFRAAKETSPSSAGQAGDDMGLSTEQITSSESVAELVEEGQFFEA